MFACIKRWLKKLLLAEPYTPKVGLSAERTMKLASVQSGIENLINLRLTLIKTQMTYVISTNLKLKSHF